MVPSIALEIATKVGIFGTWTNRAVHRSGDGVLVT
jgi:hypothetical protein